MTTLTLPRRFMRPVASRPARRSMLFGLLAGLAAGFLLLVAASLALGIATAGQVMPGVRIGGIEVGGLDAAGTRARLAERLPSLDTGSATIVVDEITEIRGYEELGRRYELARMADAALSVARGGDPIADGVARLRNVFHATSIPVLVRGYDDAAVRGMVADLAEQARIAPVDAEVVRRDAGYGVTPARDGRELETTPARAAIAASLAAANPSDVRITLEPSVVAADVSTADAWRAARAADRITAPIALTVPGADEAEDPEPVATLERETLMAWVTFGTTGAGTYGALLDEEAIAAAVEPLVEDVDREPVNAGFSVSGGGLGGVIAGQDGRTLRVEDSAAALAATLDARAKGRTRAALPLAVDLVEPSLTTAQAQAAFPQMRMVSSWTTNYVPGISNGFGANISIPAGDIDGTTVAPGDWFSFWGGLGPINTARGYTYGGAIINGRSEPTGALAGGICSTSTTLFNAAMRLGLEIGDRENHSYYIDRYPVGLDATVIKGDGYQQDMTFRNDTEHPLVIRGFGAPGRITFQLWSVPNERRVALSAPYITDRRSAIDTTQVDPSLAPGEARRIESPHDGMNVTVSRTVYDAGGAVLHEDRWFSDYRTVNGIVLTGPAAAAPPVAADPGTGGGGTTDGEAPEPTPAP